MDIILYISAQNYQIDSSNDDANVNGIIQGNIKLSL